MTGWEGDGRLAGIWKSSNVVLMMFRWFEGAGLLSSPAAGREASSRHRNALPAGEGKAKHQQPNDCKGVKACA